MPPRAEALPLSARVTDAVCVGFALWTVCTHGVVAVGGGLRMLLWTYALAGAASLGLWWTLFRRRAAEPVSGPSPPPPRSPVRQGLQAAGLALGLTAAIAFHFQGNVIALWATGMGVLAAAALCFVLLEPPWIEPPARGARLEAGLWLLALGCAAISLAAHRPDMDDAFYVNLAVSAADFPDRPLLSGDTLHGAAELPLLLPVYRFHSYEIWNGMLAWLSGRPAIEVFHWLSTALVALLVPLAHARAFRWLVPRDWLWASAALVFVLLAVGDTHRWYGNFAFVRIWQGKGVYLFVFLPLVYAYALEFGRRRTLGAWLRLAAAQIAALGCTSSAFWGAPAAALVALCCVLRPGWKDLRSFGLGALSSGYVLLVGWIAKGIMVSGGHTPGPRRLEAAAGVRLEEALAIVFGADRLLAAAAAAWLASWAFCRRGLGQRFAIVAPLAVGLVLLNPLTSSWVISNVTSSSYWRALWALPIPILMAFVLISPLQLARSRGSRWLASAAALAAVAAFAAFVPTFSALSPHNVGSGGVDFRLGWPQLKVPPVVWRWARALNDAVPPGSAVIAPWQISTWIPTLHDHALPLEVRPSYLRTHREQLGDTNIQVRQLLGRIANGKRESERDPEIFERALERFAIRGVLLRRNPRTSEMRQILEEAGFHIQLRATDYEIWVRD